MNTTATSTRTPKTERPYKPWRDGKVILAVALAVLVAVLIVLPIVHGSGSGGGGQVTPSTGVPGAKNYGVYFKP